MEKIEYLVLGMLINIVHIPWLDYLAKLMQLILTVAIVFLPLIVLFLCLGTRTFKQSKTRANIITAILLIWQVVWFIAAVRTMLGVLV
jgi:hypothetical protein